MQYGSRPNTGLKLTAPVREGRIVIVILTARRRVAPNGGLADGLRLCALEGVYAR